MHSHVLKSVTRVFAFAILASLPIALAAQSKPAAKGTSDDYASKWDIFLGYSYLSPHATVQVPQYGGGTLPYSYQAVNVGGLFSGAYYFNRYVGAQVELGEHYYGGDYSTKNNDGFGTVAAGLIARFPTGQVTPFVHGLVDAANVEGPDLNGPKWGPGVTVGGGMDYETPWMNHRIAIRIFQADYEYMHADFGSAPTEGRANINAARLSTGIVFHVGSQAPPAPVTLACSANPTSVFPGDPVTVTAAAGGLDPKDHVIYTWSGTGVTGKDATATVATGALAAGTYTVNCGVKEGKPGKEGLKPWESATATASFTVKEFEPPTISCSANPSTIKPGDTSTITSVGMSPQNRPLTYTYSASAGTVSGSGTTAEFSSAGAPTGAVGITCNVSDDKGHSATANTTVTILAPPPPPQPHASALCSLSFSTDLKRPTRVDNEAKACLDQVALTLKQQADAKAVIVGEENAKEQATTAKEQALAAKHRRTKVEEFAAQRAVNAKDYLVTDQGIDASRISVATGTTGGQTTEDYWFQQVQTSPATCRGPLRLTSQR